MMVTLNMSLKQNERTGLIKTLRKKNFNDKNTSTHKTPELCILLACVQQITEAIAVKDVEEK